MPPFSDDIYQCRFPIPYHFHNHQCRHKSRTCSSLAKGHSYNTVYDFALSSCRFTPILCSTEACSTSLVAKAINLEFSKATTVVAVLLNHCWMSIIINRVTTSIYLSLPVSRQGRFDYRLRHPLYLFLRIFEFWH